LHLLDSFAKNLRVHELLGGHADFSRMMLVGTLILASIHPETLHGGIHGSCITCWVLKVDTKDSASISGLDPTFVIIVHDRPFLALVVII